MKLTNEEICRIAIECGHAMRCEGYADDTLWFDGDLTEFARKIEDAVFAVQEISEQAINQPL